MNVKDKTEIKRLKEEVKQLEKYNKDWSNAYSALCYKVECYLVENKVDKLGRTKTQLEENLFNECVLSGGENNKDMKQIIQFEVERLEKKVHELAIELAKMINEHLGKEELEKKCRELKEENKKSNYYVNFVNLEIEAAKQENTQLKTQIKQIHKDYGCELRDPNGTIWEQADKVQKENENLKTKLKERTEECTNIIREFINANPNCIPNNNWITLSQIKTEIAKLEEDEG